MAEQSLKDKTVNGVVWSSVDAIAKYGIEFIVSLVLARLLSPDEYGLIGIIMIFIIIFGAIVNGGFSTALIRKKNVSEDDFNTVFISNLVVSIGLAIVMYLCAPLVASFFKRPELTALTQAMSLVLVINALSLVQGAQLTIKIDFKTQTKIAIIASSISGVVGIGMALLNYGVWALVGQQITRQSLNTILLWIYNKWLPKLRFSIQSFKELFGFGWKLLVATVICTSWDQIYQAVIGKIYSPATLGQYTRANQFGSFFSSNIGNVVNRVSLPALSSVQEDNLRLSQAFRKLIKCSMLISLVFTMGIAAIAKPMILVLIGEQWLLCVPFLQILCFSMVLYPLHLLNLNILSVQGRSDIQLVLQIIKIILSIGPLALGLFVNIYWMLIGSIVVSYMALFLNAYYSGKKLNYTCWDQLRDILPSIGIAFAMAIPVYLLSFIPISPFVVLPIQIIVGAVITYALCEWTKLEEYIQLKSITLNYIRRIFHK